MREPREVVLGDQHWTVRPLTLEQVEKVDLILNDPGNSPAQRLLKVIAVGISRTEPKHDLAYLKTIEAGLDELDAAARVIFDLAGVKLKTKEPEKGEGTATA